MRSSLVAVLIVLAFLPLIPTANVDPEEVAPPSDGPLPPSEPVLNSIPEELMARDADEGPDWPAGPSEHSLIYSTPEPPRRSSAIGPMAVDKELVLVLIEKSLMPALNASISQYVDDLEVTGYNVKVFKGSWSDPPSVRMLLNRERNNFLVGAILVGDIVEAWYEILNGPASWGIQEFPTDLFYMDLDGSWTDSDADDMYDGHTGNVAPEIWVGRLMPSTLGDELSLLRNYFRKNHDYRTGDLTLPHKALVYVDEDWNFWSHGWNASVAQVYPDSTLVNDESGNNVNKADYMNRLTEDHEWIHVGVHSGSASHWFKVDGRFPYDQIFHTTEMEAIDPHCHFYNLWACSNSRFTRPYCMGSMYAFTDTYGLLSIGSTKTGGMINPDSFYTPLAKNVTIGSAFRQWFDDEGEANRNWTYGMVILGDPTLTTHHDLHAVSPEVTSPPHPDPAECYANSTAVFEWEEPRDMTGIEGYWYRFDRNPISTVGESNGIWTRQHNATYEGLTEGIWYFHIVAVDILGNVARVPTHFRVEIDTTPPTGSITINDGDVYTTSPNISLTIGAEDHGGVVSMRFSTDGVTWGEWFPVATQHSLELPEGDGMRSVNLQVRDRAGLVNHGDISDTITLDTTPPRGTLKIESYQGFTSKGDPIVYVEGIDASGIASMRLSDDGLIWGPWIPFAATTRWSLPSGDGAKWVFLELRDKAGLVSVEAITATVVLDTTPPGASFTIDGGAMYTTSRNVTLDIEVEDSSPVDWVRTKVRDGEWSPWHLLHESMTLELPEGDGIATVTIEVRDRAWVVSQGTVQRSIVLDTTPPKGQLAVNDDAAYTRQAEVTISLLTVEENGNPEMRTSFDGMAWTPWEPSMAKFNVTIPGEDGNRFIHVELRDPAGLVSVDPIVTSIILDTVPPSGTLAFDGPEGRYTNSTLITIRLIDDPSGDAEEMRLKVEGGPWSVWEPFSKERAIELSPHDGLQSVHVEFRDLAGWVSMQPLKLIVHLDTELAMQVTHSLSGWYASDPSAVLTLAHRLEDEGSGLSYYGISYNGGITFEDTEAIRSNGLSWDIPLDWSALEEGPNRVVLRLADRAGNVATHQLEVLRDTGRPTVSVPSTRVVSDAPDALVRWESSDAVSDVARTMVYIDSQDSIDVTGRHLHKLDGLLNGRHTVRIVVEDSAGNTAEATVLIDVDAGMFNTEHGDLVALSLVVVLTAVAVAAGLVVRSRRRGD
jgi:hypothetical protein